MAQSAVGATTISARSATAPRCRKMLREWRSRRDVGTRPCRGVPAGLSHPASEPSPLRGLKRARGLRPGMTPAWARLWIVLLSFTTVSGSQHTRRPTERASRGALHLTDRDRGSVAAGLFRRGRQVGEWGVDDAIGVESEGGRIVPTEAFDEHLGGESTPADCAGLDAGRLVDLVAQRP